MMVYPSFTRVSWSITVTEDVGKYLFVSSGESPPVLVLPSYVTV